MIRETTFLSFLALLSSSQAFLAGTRTSIFAAPRYISVKLSSTKAQATSHLEAQASAHAPHVDDLTNVVMKFGGSSLADAERIRYVADLIASQKREERQRPVVVCSAMGSSTNLLLAAAQSALQGEVDLAVVTALHLDTCDALGVSDQTRSEVVALLGGLEKVLSGVMCLGELSPRSKDLVVSFGERMSVRLVAAQLNLCGVRAQAFDVWELGLTTNSEFGDAEILSSSYDAIRRKMAKVFETNACSPGYEQCMPLEEERVVPVVTGFLGQDPQGRITTLGRGGSDLTAAVIAAACGFQEIQVWKDVNGMLTADPRVVPTAVPVPSVTFDEASELAYFGAKILHPVSMQPARKYNIPVRIKNSYNPSHPGTLIDHEVFGRCEGCLVTAITTKRQQCLIDVVSTRMLGQYGFLATVFSVFEKHKLSVDVVATSEVSVSLTLGAERMDLIQSAMSDLSSSKSEFNEESIAEVEVRHGRSILSLIADVTKSSDVMAAVFRILAEEKIQVEMLSQGASKVNISLVLKDEDLNRALRALHGHFFAAEVARAGPFVPPPEK
mmetsp:Transcript_43342/g.85509  ORF Transcript_43342/g.85509 Transcript_43342/m.85509 type:complete len:555 (+) Transcript_43342:78-1742(+)